MNVDARPTIYGIAICAGVAMLDEGVAAAMEYLGFNYRTVCYVERDSYATSAIVARMESKALDQALVWDDLTTFPGRAFRGRVHCIVAGFPCQDISLAGRREGLDGARSGLFFNILDIADKSGAEFLFLENVAGIDSATATVVYEGEELFERASARVVGELADRGWSAEWLRIRASEVGASHERDRWFCFAWRELADTESRRRRFRKRFKFSRRNETQGTGQQLDNTAGTRCQRARIGTTAEQRGGQCLSGEGCENLANTESVEFNWQQSATPAGRKSGTDRCGTSVADARLQHQQLQQRRDGREHSGSCTEVELAEGERCGQRRTEHEFNRREHSASEHGIELGEPDGTNCEGGGLEDRAGRWEEQDGYAGLASGELFAPGPSDIRWPDILARYPCLAPAIKPGVCRVVNGMAYRVDEYRADRLRCGGNGVVPLQAAIAYIELIRRVNL